MALTITPQTHGTLAITVKAGTTLLTDAIVTADIIDSTGKRVATNVPCNHAGSGVYNLSILPEWSESDGKVVEGQYYAEIKAVRAGKQRVRRIFYTVTFGRN